MTRTRTMALFVSAVFTGALGLGAAVVPLACSSSSASHTPAGDASTNGDDAAESPLDGSRGDAPSAPTDAGDAGAESDDASDAEGPHAFARVADFIAPRLQDMDFCVSTDAPSDSAHWVGPFLWPSSAVVVQGSVSPYAHVPVGTQSLRVVPKSPHTCVQTMAGIPDFALPTPLAENSHATLVVSGTGYDAGAGADGGSDLIQLFPFVDRADPADGGNSMRFLNFVQGDGAIDLYAHAGSGSSTCTLIYGDVTYGHYGTSAGVDDAGPTASDGYTPLRNPNLGNLFFNTMTANVHGDACTAPSVQGFYSTSAGFGEGAWSIFLYGNAGGTGHTYCRDDGADTPLCYEN